MSTEQPKKRGRRKKIIGTDEEEPKKETKKSKIQEIKLQSLQNNLSQSLHNNSKKNIILNLNCTMKEVEEYLQSNSFNSDHFVYKPKAPEEIKPFEPANQGNYELFETNTPSDPQKTPLLTETSKKVNMEKEIVNDDEVKNKLKELKLTFYKNEQTKKSACFWCTYDFDNDTCYIIQQSTQGNYMGHGSFCSPECSVAYLFNNMKWDDSAKMESYQLINYYYGTSNHYEKHIKPAASPYYFLEKFYGNMTIHEYRKMCKSNYMLLCIDKPMTRVLPEIHEDNEKIVFNNTPSTQTRGNYKVKRQSEKGAAPNRNSILRDNFGVGS